MHGNAYEWCRDAYDASFYEEVVTDGGSSDPCYSTDDEGVKRVLRGGCCRSAAIECRSAARWFDVPGRKQPFIGFRVVLQQ
jgi:formylglycine-generating enzyme required for sulfatase activity